MATFTVVLHTREAGIRALRAALKLLPRRFSLRALKIEQTADTD